jgi:hypothetical protein
MQPLDKLVPSEVEQQNMKDAMRGHYLHLSELFKSYSSVGAGIRTNDMDLMEFSSFMHDSKVSYKELQTLLYQASSVLLGALLHPPLTDISGK